MPAFVLDRTAASGGPMPQRSVVIAPEPRLAVAEMFSQKVVGSARTTSHEARLIDRGGRRRLAEIDAGIVMKVRPEDLEPLP